MSDAERARAYRQRKAEEHAGVDELRAERRVLRRQVSDAVRGRERAEVAADVAAARAELLDKQLAITQEQLDRARHEVTLLRTRLAAALEQRAAPPPRVDSAPTGAAPAAPVASAPTAGLSRQQRRAVARKGKRRT